MTDFVKWLKAQDPEVIRDPFSAAAGWAAGQKAEQEKYQELIAAAEAVIEAAERHGSVGYADNQMVNLQAAIERMMNNDF